MQVRSSAGQATGTFTLNVAGRPSAVGDLSIRHLSVAPFVEDPTQTSDITADTHVDLRAAALSDIDTLTGSVSLEAPLVVVSNYRAENLVAQAQFEGRQVWLNAHAGAYGAGATVTGRVTLAKDHEPTMFDLGGQATHLNLRRLPADLHVPPADTDVSADCHLVGWVAPAPSGKRQPYGARRITLHGDAAFLDSTVPGAHIQAGSTATFSLNDGAIGYRGDVTADAVNLQRLAEAFNVPVLATDRAASQLNVHLVAAGHGTTPADMELTARGALHDSSLVGGQIPELEFEATVLHDVVHIMADGAFAELDPAVVSGRSQLNGTIAGTIDVDATISKVSSGITPDTITATVSATLDRSTIGLLVVDWANLDGDYDGRTGTIRDLELGGPDVNATATGTLALNDTGASHLAFRADSARLERIGTLTDTPLTGLATIEGTITGNRPNLHAQGTVMADNAAYGENGAFTLSTRYTIDVPELAFDRATIAAQATASFVTLAGQHIDELTAQATYRDKELTFDTTARQPERALAMAGALTLHPDHQEAHLRRLALDAQGQSWELAAGSSPAVHYGQGVVTVEGLALSSADQRIMTEGTFGRPGTQLHVALDNIDLASVDALLLRPAQLSGRLNATTSISGTTTVPDVHATFSVARGGFRQFHYEAFEGHFGYSPKGVTLDTTLRQSGTQWLTLKGHIPTAMFVCTAQPAACAHIDHEAAAADDQIDLAIDSSPTDLGVVQGLTAQVTGVQGTVEAHVHVTGTSDHPHPSGRLTVVDAAATIEPAGVRYSHIGGQIDLEPDRLHVDHVTLLDSQQHALTVTGDLDLREREIGAVRLYVNADDVKVIDNNIGNIRVQGQVEIAGALRAPRVEGSLALTTGRIDLDQLIALAVTSPYATEQAPIENRQSTDSVQPRASPFDALRMDVHVTVPNDFIVKAPDLQVPGAPNGLGALNVMLGGDIRAVKDPGGKPGFIGIVNTVRGTYDFQGRRFEILRDGTIQFEGFTPPNPSLNIRTRRLIRGVEAHVDVRGTLSKPQIVLSSVPPLEPADILALIVFNQPINQLGASQQLSLVARAQALATNAAISQLAQSIGSALNLETFEINAMPETGVGPQLTIGQQVAQNVYVKVQQGIGDHSTTNFMLEYQFLDWLRLQTNLLQGSSVQQSLFRRAQGSGADLIFLFSY
jgi:hypothetical protein